MPCAPTCPPASLPPCPQHVAWTGLGIFVLSGVVALLPLVGVGAYVKYDGFCYIDYRNATHDVLWLLVAAPCLGGALYCYAAAGRAPVVPTPIRAGLVGLWVVFLLGCVAAGCVAAGPGLGARRVGDWGRPGLWDGTVWPYKSVSVSRPGPRLRRVPIVPGHVAPERPSGGQRQPTKGP